MKIDQVKKFVGQRVFARCRKSSGAGGIEFMIIGKLTKGTESNCDFVITNDTNDGKVTFDAWRVQTITIDCSKPLPVFEIKVS